MSTENLPVAIDAMGGDYAPDEIIKGAQMALDSGIPVLLVGTPDALKSVKDIPTIDNK